MKEAADNRPSNHLPWGSMICTWCDEPVNSDGNLSCTCVSGQKLSKTLYRVEPAAPTSAARIFHNQRLRNADPAQTIQWHESVEAFRSLSERERTMWNSKAFDEVKRYEKEKEEYNQSLDLDEDILTDEESEAQHECENGYIEERQGLQRLRCEQLWSRYRRDHERFNNTIRNPSNITGPGCFHRFGELPVEIRDRIYEFILQIPRLKMGLRQWQLIYESNSYDHGSHLIYTDLLPLDTRILAANRQVYLEALNVLYASNSFVVDVTRGSVLPNFVARATGLEAPYPTSRIRRWHIRLVFTNVDDKSTISWQLDEIRKVMSHCLILEEVRFSWITVPHYWSELPQLVQEYDAMLESFYTIHSVGQVVFTEKPWHGFENLELGSNEKRTSVKARMERRVT
ncbi:MAG: hypothetical protein Q9167_001193 [Letrouitia subvulpina]